MSCCRCFLIEEDCLRLIVPQLSELVTMKMLSSAFRLAHDRDIIPLIGAPCADRYCVLKENPPQSGDPDYDEWVLLQTLVSELQELGSWAVYMRYLESFPVAQLTSSGLSFAKDGSNPFVTSELKVSQQMTDTARNNYEFYVAGFGDWLKSENPDTERPWRESFACLPQVSLCDPTPEVYNPPFLITLGSHPQQIFPHLP